MDDIIRQLSGRLGLDPDQAAAGAGAVFKTIQDNVAGGDFQKLLQQLPQVKSWMGKAEAGTGAGGPDTGGGGLLGMAGGLLGGLGAGGAGSLGELATLLGKNGLSLETASKLLPVLMDLLKDRVDPALIEKLVSSVPALQGLLGGKGGGLGDLGKIFG